MFAPIFPGVLRWTNGKWGTRKVPCPDGADGDERDSAPRARHHCAVSLRLRREPTRGRAVAMPRRGPLRGLHLVAAILTFHIALSSGSAAQIVCPTGGGTLSVTSPGSYELKSTPSQTQNIQKGSFTCSFHVGLPGSWTRIQITAVDGDPGLTWGCAYKRCFLLSQTPSLSSPSAHFFAPPVYPRAALHAGDIAAAETMILRMVGRSPLPLPPPIDVHGVATLFIRAEVMPKDTDKAPGGLSHVPHD